MSIKDMIAQDFRYQVSHHCPVGSVGRVPVCQVRDQGFIPRPDQQPGSLKNWQYPASSDLRSCLSSDDHIIGQ